MTHSNQEFRSILVIDEDETDRMLIRRLVPEGTIVYEAGDASAGRLFFEQFRPDCVLVEFRLPDANGLDLTSQLLAVDQDAAIIMFTREGAGEVAIEAFRRGVLDYLSKTKLTSELLRRSIENARLKSKMNALVGVQLEQYSAFASDAAHHLRAPLRKLRSWIALLGDGSMDRSSEAAGPAVDLVLRRVQKSVGDLERILDELQGYAKTGVSKGAEAVDLNQVLAACLDRLENDLE